MLRDVTLRYVVLATGSVGPWFAGELCQPGRPDSSLPDRQQSGEDRPRDSRDSAARLRPAGLP